MNGSAITRYSNSIQALVYAGAAFLVVIVGLRGLGDLSHAGFIPSFLLDEGSGRIAANVVIAGLIAEFVMLLAMAAVFFHAPKTTPVHGTAVVSIDPAASGIHAAALIESERKLLDSIGRKMETLIDSEREIIDSIGAKFNHVAEAERGILELITRRIEDGQRKDAELLQHLKNTMNALTGAHTPV